MNYLSGPAVPDPGHWNTGLFTVSGAGVPCTKGMDVILEPEPLAAFVARAHEGVPGSAPIPVAPSMERGSVLWCDFEGKGDEGVDHDTRIAVPAVTLSSVLIYNHPNTALKSDILSALGLIAGAAEQAGMDAAAAGGVAAAQRFGHLHVCVRDYTLDSELGDARYEAEHAGAIWTALMADEPVRRKGTDAERDRNSIRALLRRCFRSMTRAFRARLWAERPLHLSRVYIHPSPSCCVQCGCSRSLFRWATTPAPSSFAAWQSCATASLSRLRRRLRALLERAPRTC